MFTQFIKRLFARRPAATLLSGTAAAVTAGVAGTAAQGYVVYTPVDLPVDASNTSQNIDFANDGLPPVSIDYSLTAGLTLNKQTLGSYPSFVAATTSSTVPTALPFGAPIDNTQTYAPTPGTLDELGATPSGEFTQAAGLEYIGMEFNELSYGWIGFQTTNDSDPADLAGTIVGYAYETDAGVGITAGEVPEPTSLALLALGATGMAAYRRRAGAR